MKDDLSKKLGYVLWALLGSSVLLTLMFFMEWVSVNFMLNWTYGLFAIAALSSIVFPIIVLAQDPKKAKGAAISLVGLIVVLGLAYVMASDAVPLSYEKYGVDAGTSQLVGMGIIATYTLMLVSVVGIFFFGVMNALKS